MQTAIVNISAAGEVKVEAQGVRGTDCAALTREIEASLGRVTADVKKPEYFQQQTQNASAKR
jgi:hypothetical protein